MNLETLRDLQKAQVEMVKAFVSFCGAEGLTWFLTGGSMLGAVRHRGFIPWDDDVDIGMLRVDFDRFVTLRMGDEYTVSSEKTDAAWGYCFCKIYKKGLFYRGSAVFIDVFPYDNAPAGNIACRLQDWFFSKFNALALYKQKKLVSLNKIKLFIIALIAPLFSLSLLQKLRYKSMTVFAKNETPCLVQWTGTWRLEREKFDKNIFFPLGQYEFEGLLYPGPADYRRYLTQMYGDYQKLPPEAERQSHFE
jgi:lipopolysaccharide cholinephosphotransferase